VHTSTGSPKNSPQIIAPVIAERISQLSSSRHHGCPSLSRPKHGVPLQALRSSAFRLFTDPSNSPLAWNQPTIPPHGLYVRHAISDGPSFARDARNPGAPRKSDKNPRPWRKFRRRVFSSSSIISIGPQLFGAPETVPARKKQGQSRAFKEVPHPSGANVPRKKWRTQSIHVR